MKKYTHVTTNDFILDIVAHPAFTGFGRHLFPQEYRDLKAGTRLTELGSLMPYHSHVKPEQAAQSINRLIDDAGEGKQIFYDFYTDEEEMADPEKLNTGLFFLRGKKGAPFALICPGGGFSYVAALHEGISYAMELNSRGYNAFVLIYRIAGSGGARMACEDLAAALEYITAHAAELAVDGEHYSLWGSSAGARVAAWLGTYGPAAFGRNAAKPESIILGYTAHTHYSTEEPPTFAFTGENDRIAPDQIMKRRIEAVQKTGADTEFHVYSGVGHGFGLGTGTPAAGWFNEAVRFWEAHMSENNSAAQEK